jgi:hypothetical protein
LDIVDFIPLKINPLYTHFYKMDTNWDAKIALFLENTASSVKKNGVRHKKKIASAFPYREEQVDRTGCLVLK